MSDYSNLSDTSQQNNSLKLQKQYAKALWSCPPEILCLVYIAAQKPGITVNETLEILNKELSIQPKLVNSSTNLNYRKLCGELQDDKNPLPFPLLYRSKKGGLSYHHYLKEEIDLEEIKEVMLGKNLDPENYTLPKTQKEISLLEELEEKSKPDNIQDSEETEKASVTANFLEQIDSESPSCHPTQDIEDVSNLNNSLDLELELEHVKNQINQLERDIDTRIKKEVSDIMKYVAGLRQMIGDLVQQNTALQKKNEELENEVQDLRTKIEDSSSPTWASTVLDKFMNVDSFQQNGHSSHS